MIKLNLWQLLVAHVFGIKTPMGFRLRPQAFMTVKAMNDELVSLKSRYEYALKINESQNKQAEETHANYLRLFKDNQRLSKALKELSKKPVVVSAETLELLESFKGSV